MIEILLITILYSKYHKLKIKPFLRSWNLYVVVVLTILYIGLTATIFLGHYDFIQYRKFFHIALFSSFVIMAALNNISFKQLFTSLSCFMFGNILNRIAITRNNGKMPVFPTNSIATGFVTKEMIANNTLLNISPMHTIADPINTKVIPLCDIFDLGYTIFSIGDLFIYLALSIILIDKIIKLNGSGSNVV